MSKELRWIKIAASIHEILFAPNQIAEVDADGKPICVALYNNEIYAFPRKCPHASGPLSEGFIDVLGNVVCPLHRYKFDLKNGRNVTGEGYYLRRWPVETREDGIYIGFEKSTFFGLL